MRRVRAQTAFRTTLSQILCGPVPQHPRKVPKKFTQEDRESHGLKIRVTECDEFRRCPERQAAYHSVSVEDCNINAAMGELESNDEDSFLDPETGEVVANTVDFGDYLGCKVDAVVHRTRSVPV